MPDEINPDAQGQQDTAGEVSNVESAQPAQRQPGEGVQRRIDELTAKWRQAERTVEQFQAQNAELTSQMAQLLMRQAQQSQPVDPGAQLDPDERRKFDAMMAPFRAELASYRAQTQEQLQAMQFAQAAAGLPTEVQQRAQQLLANWRKAGLSGWNVQDALVYAQGQIALEQARNAAQSRDERGRFNGASQNLPGGHAPNPSLNPAPKDAPVPTDIDSWPAEKQAAFWEKRLGGKVF